MTLEQLRIFVAVAEREHVTRAAAALNLTQSAVSAAIGALETRHAVHLFDRVGRRIVLTEAGRLFLDEARAILARTAQAERLLDDLAGLHRGTLRLAGSQTVASYWLPAIMQRFRAAHPGFSLDLVVGNTTTVAQMVHSAQVDLGVIEGEIDDPSLAVDTLPGDELAVVVAPGHPWTAAPPASFPATPGDLIASPWVLREPGSGTRAVLEQVLAGAGLAMDRLTIALELPTNEAVRTAVEAGAGAAMLSTLVVQPSLATGRLTRIPFEVPPRPFHILRHKERHFSLAERRFLAFAKGEETASAP